MKLVTAIVKPFKLDEVKDALKAIGVHGHDGHRGAWLRPPGRPHRDLPRRRVQRSTSFPRCGSRSWSTTARSTRWSRPSSVGGDGQDRRRQDLGHHVDRLVRIRTGEEGADTF